MSQVPPRISGRNPGLTLAFALGGVTLALAVWAAVSELEPVVSNASLEGIDFETMSGMEVSVLPADVQPQVSRQAAERVTRDLPSWSVKDAVFARVVTSTFDGPAWIVSLDPGGWKPPGRAGSGVVEFLYLVVDAETGEFVMAHSRSSEPPGGFDFTAGGPSPAVPHGLNAPAGIGQ